MPNVDGNVYSVRGDVFNHVVLHEGVDFSVADEVSYDVVHELIHSLISDFHAIVSDDLSNFAFQVLLGLLLCFKVFKADVYFLN